MYGNMAHFLADRLNIRPSEILDGWSVPELIVAYGNYANLEARKNFETWKSMDHKERAKYPRPMEYAVYFRGEL